MKQHIQNILLLLLFCSWYFVNEVYQIFLKIDPVLWIKYIAIYTSLGAIIYGLIQYLQKNALKSWTFSQVSLIALLMYGFLKDLIGNWIPVLGKHLVFNPIYGIIFVWILYKIYHSKKLSQKFQQFVAVCISLFIIFSVYSILSLPPLKIHPQNIYTETPTQKKFPNVYIFVFDELIRLDQLESFGYQAAPFLEKLQQNGAKILSKSYSYSDATPISVSSILNAQVIQTDSLKYPLQNFEKYLVWDVYQKNYLVDYLHKLNYDSELYGILSFKNLNNYTGYSFLRRLEIKLLRQNTLIGRIEEELAWNLVKYDIPFLKEWVLEKENNIRYEIYQNDSLNLEKIKQSIVLAKDQPKFRMGHFYFPHYPYNKDSLGKFQSYQSLELEGKENISRYIEQVKYAEKEILSLLDHVKKSKEPTIALFLGDHGYRSAQDSSMAVNSFLAYYSNIELPTMDDSLSAVNFMRIVLNNQFGYQLPKDSSKPQLIYY